jgi:hypothetical protein
MQMQRKTDLRITGPARYSEIIETRQHILLLLKVAAPSIRSAYNRGGFPKNEKGIFRIFKTREVIDGENYETVY